jgi:hypothetical protein
LRLHLISSDDADGLRDFIERRVGLDAGRAARGEIALHRPGGAFDLRRRLGRRRSLGDLLFSLRRSNAPAGINVDRRQRNLPALLGPLRNLLLRGLLTVHSMLAKQTD